MEKTQNKRTVKFFNGKEIPLEMHKVRIVQSLKLVPVEQSLSAIRQAGFNSLVEYLIDRLNWLYHNKELVGGLRFVEEPPVLRFFTGRLEPVSNWPEKLIAKFKADFGDSL